MKAAMGLFIGVMATVLSSYFGLVVAPELQLEALEPVELDDGSNRPYEPYGDIALGREVYADLGCIYCHSQQVRPDGFGSDIERGWGRRGSVALDYLYDEPPLLGTMRTGPDLANIGARQPSEAWHYLHLYNPQITSEGSIMPPFRFLFDEVERANRARPPAALDLPEGFGPDDAWVVPTRRARALVSYLLSLRQTYPVAAASSDDSRSDDE